MFMGPAVCRHRVRCGDVERGTAHPLGIRSPVEEADI